MKVYIDYIFVQNFIVDLILLKETSYLTKNYLKNKKAIFASLVASIYVAILIWFKVNQLNFFVSKILLAFVIIYISFKPTQIKKYIKLILFFLLVSILNIGTFTMVLKFTGIKGQSIKEEILFYIVSLVVSKFAITKLWKAYKRKIRDDSLIYDVEFNIGKEKYKYKAFLDTGNNVYSLLNNLPILFAQLPDKLIKESELNKLKNFEIRTTTLSNTSVKKAYVIDNIKISKGDYNLVTKAGIVFERGNFTKEGDYNMILNYYLYTEKMGGIKV